MSTQVSEIVVQAFREGNFIAVGETTTAEELVEAVPRLRNYISSLLGIEIGEQLRDWFAPTSFPLGTPLQHPLTPTGTGATSTAPWRYPSSNSRLVVTITSADTIFFPSMPNDGARMTYVDKGSTVGMVTLDGNGRFIEGVPSITDAADPNQLHGRKWFYRADLADWIRVDQPLQAVDEVPLPEEFDDLLVTGLAIRLAPRFGVQIDKMIVARNADMLERLKKRYKQSERMPSSSEMRQIFQELP